MGRFKSPASKTPTSASAERFQRINTESRDFQGLETDLHRSSIRGAGDQPRRGCQLHPTATAHLQRCCAGAGETLHRLLRCPSRCSRSDRHHQKQMPFQRELWTNKKVIEFGASTTTPAAFQSGQHNRWLAAEMCGEHADTGQRGCKRIQLSQKNSVRPENALHSHKQRYSLISDRLDPASLRKAEVVKYTPGERLRQATIARNPPHLRTDRFCRTAQCNPPDTNVFYVSPEAIRSWIEFSALQTPHTTYPPPPSLSASQVQVAPNALILPGCYRTVGT